MKKTWNGEVLLALGFKEGKVLGVLLQSLLAAAVPMNKHWKLLLTKFLKYPEEFLGDEIFGAAAAIEMEDRKIPEINTLQEEPMTFATFGAEYIEEGAFAQMRTAMRLPVTVGGALMPDAHQGYGLPIGGVLATRNAVIPYGVGVDIGCRMALSIMDIPEEFYRKNESKFKRELIDLTRFGAGHGFKPHERAEHAVLEHEVFNDTLLLKGLKDKAFAQLGTSGGGNHFVEWGIITYEKDDVISGMKKGRYLALLSHSGSRALGATIAGHYTKLAKNICPLPKEAAHLAYLDLKSAEGLEYWRAMNLAGDYASACHEVIHDKLTKAMGAQVLHRVENHHNFAWKEIWQGEEVIVHRKGATPAGEGVMGIIPGSMTAPGFLVRGKGESTALNSASHGAGRKMSRTKAIQTFTKSQMKDLLQKEKVTLIGAGLDEAPMAYKNIHKVMSAQTALVDVVASFQPSMVRMAEDGSRED
jgi:tRNA-splicing ligase RtcB